MLGCTPSEYFSRATEVDDMFINIALDKKYRMMKYG